MNVDEISEWQWGIERGRWQCDQRGDGAPRIVTATGLYVCQAGSVETAEYIVGLHNARFTPCMACGGYHASLMQGCVDSSKGAPGDDRPWGAAFHLEAHSGA